MSTPDDAFPRRLAGAADRRPSRLTFIAALERLDALPARSQAPTASTLHAIHGRRSRRVGNSHRGGANTLENLAR